jgi:hypothetical protein
MKAALLRFIESDSCLAGIEDDLIATPFAVAIIVMANWLGVTSWLFAKAYPVLFG